MVLAKLLEELIAQSGLTQQEVEKRADLSRGYLSKILSGERKSLQSKTQTRLAQALGVPRSALDTDTPEVSHPTVIASGAQLTVATTPSAAAPPPQYSSSRAVVLAQLQHVYPDEVLAALERLEVPSPDPGEDYWLKEARRLDNTRTEIEESRRRARLERDRVELDLAERHRQLIHREEDISQAYPKITTLQDHPNWFAVLRRTVQKYKDIRLSSLFVVGANTGWDSPQQFNEDDLARLARNWEKTTSDQVKDEAELALVAQLVEARAKHAAELKQKGIVGAELIVAMRKFDKQKRFENEDPNAELPAPPPNRHLRAATPRKKP